MTRTRFTLHLAAFLSLVLVPSVQAGSYGDWVAGHFTPAQIALGMASPHGDHDGDLCPNLLEYLGGTDPADAASTFAPAMAFDPVLDEITVSFATATGLGDIEHVIHVSHDMAVWAPGAVFVCQDPALTYHLNGHQYVMVGVRPRPGVRIDSDHDGLSDFFEESLVSSDPGDGFTHIGQILPGDDFDGDGTPNLDEEDNGPPPGTFTKPSTLDPAAVACALDGTPPPSPATLVVHTVLN